MITFKYKIISSKKRPEQKYIVWDCRWDGKHNDKHLDPEGWEYSPFIDTHDYQDLLKRYNDAMARLRRHKKKSIYLHTPYRPNKKRAEKNAKSGFHDMRDIDIFVDSSKLKYTKEDIERELNPDNIRKSGDYVAYNAATLGLCQILADKENLHKHCGNTTPYCYFTKLLGALCVLWD